MTNYFSKEYLLLLNILDLSIIYNTIKNDKDNSENTVSFLQDIFYSYKISKFSWYKILIKNKFVLKELDNSISRIKTIEGENRTLLKEIKNLKKEKIL